MRHLTSIAALVGFFLSSVAIAAPAPDPDREVKEIITRALNAKGDVAVREKYKASTCKFTGTYFVDGMEISAYGIGQEQEPDKDMIKATLKFAGTDVSYIQVYNNGKGWLSINGATQELDKKTLDEDREHRHAGHLAALYGLDAPGLKITLLPESKVEGKRAIGIRISSAGYRDVSLYFDRENALLLKRSMQGRDVATGKVSLHERIYSNYRNISGLMEATKVVDQADGKTLMILELSDIEICEKLPDSAFAKP
jgi:hypothetical protein